MSAPTFPEAMPQALLKNPLQLLSLWASNSSAEADLETIFGPRLNWPSAFKHLDAFRRADFSLLPPVRTLPATDMPGLWGGYSRETREIYISADCPQALLPSVLVEEIGHFLDQELCSEETPGEEGARFAAAVLGLPLDTASQDDALAPLFLQGRTLLVEAARKLRGFSKSSKSGRKKRGSSKGSGFNSGGGSGYAEIGSKSSNPKLQQNIIYATDEGVRIPQRAAGDRLIGSQGNDTFAVISQDVRIEDPNGGTDTVESSVTFDLANRYSSIENLLLTGGGNTNATGNFKSNVISGNSGNNKLDGGIDSAIDTLIGGAGNDTYALRDTLDQIVEAVGGGSDTIETTQATFSMANYANVENLAYSGTGTGVTFTGNSGNNLLTGTAGADSLDGGDGIDTLVGGLGNDTYRVDNESDYIIENANSGKDVVVSTAATYELGDNIENLILDGSGDISGTGNDLKNTLTGNNSNNTLSGRDGDDYITGDGQLPSISLTGRTVTDVAADYLLNGTNALVNNLGTPSGITNAGSFGERVVTRGDDNSSSAIDITPIFGPNGLNLYGNQVKSIFINTNGNITFEGALSTFNPRSIDSGLGNSIIAPFWADVYTTSGRSNVSPGGSSAGTNLIYWDVDDENRVLTVTWDDVRYFGQQTSGTNADTKVNAFQVQLIDSGGGNAFIIFRYENIDWTTGTASGGTNGLGGQAARAGFNTGTGRVIELPQSGDDLSMLDLDQNLPQAGLNSGQTGVYIFEIRNGVFVENLGGNDSLLGGSGNDTIFGNGGNDTLLGEGGDDRLDGGAGADSMVGGTGNELYIVDSAFDAVVESLGEGSDTVESGISYTLTSGSHIEVLKLSGSGNLSGTGNAFDNTILGNVGTNMLSGGAGNDSLAGGGGRDTFLGGSGDDTLFAIYESDLSSSLVGGTGNDLYLVDSTLNFLNDISGNDTVESSVSYNLGAQNVIGVENLVLSGNDSLIGIGNSLANSLIGNSGANSLLGGLGRDTLLGGEGNDTLDARKDQGDTAPDRLEGGSGDDTYLVNSTSDTVVGTGYNETIVSTVSFSLASSLVSGVGNLLLGGTGDINGTGDSLANRVTGNSGINVLRGGAGDDTLLGGGGNDQFIGGEGLDLLVGGTGNDLFVAENASDAASDVFLGGGGIDSVRSAVSFDLGASNVSDINNLIYNGTADATLTGNISDNSLISQGAGNDTLIAVGGNNTLDGGQGDNFLIGGSGNDYFIVNTTGDTVIEADSDGGIDEVAVRISVPSGQVVAYKLEDDQNIEILSYEGNRQSSLVGNNLNNAIYGAQLGNTLDGADGYDYLVGGSGRDSLHGGGGDDTLDGRGGSDTLSGGEGSDYYYVDSQTANIIEINNPAPTTPRSHADAIRSSVSYSLVYNSELASKIEDLHLSGSANLQGTGNSLDNYITGNDGENTLTGQGGNDTVYGGLGADLVEGGVGNDLLFGGGTPQTDLPEDASTAVAVNPGQTYSGTFDRVGGGNLINNEDADWIRTELKAGQKYTFEFSASFVGSALELGLTSFGIDTPRTAAGGSIDGVWNFYDDSFEYAYGSYPATVAGNKKFFLEIELLRDSTIFIPVFSNGPAVGTYTLTLPQGGDPALTFGDNASNTLIGGDGSDTLIAGNGRDADGNPIGEILFGGTNGIPGSIDTDNSADSLVGGDGADVLDGGLGLDTMVGGAGNDTYFVENNSDGIVETEDGGRHDLVIASLQKNANLWAADLQSRFVALNPTSGMGFDLDLANAYSNVEHASLMGSTNLYILGNSDSNSLSGNFGNNYIDAGRGNDSLLGQGGTDYLIGGDGGDLLDGGSDVNTMDGGFGSDTYIVNDRADRIINEKEGLDGGIDVVRTYFNFDPIQGDGVNQFDPAVADNSPSVNKAKSFASEDLESFYNLENFELLDGAVYGVGNALANSITAGPASSVLYGMGGEDAVLGGDGDDTLYGDTPDFYASPDLYAAAPKDTQTQAFLDGVIGSGGSDYLDGGAGDNYLDGGSGFDTMVGGAGNDTFVQDNADDYIVAGAGANELISSVNIAQAPDGISKLMLVVKDQSPDSGQPEVAEKGSFLGTANGNNLTTTVTFTTKSFTIENSNLMELMYAPKEADRFVIGGVTDTTDAPGNPDVHALNVSPYYDDLDFPGRKKVELSWEAGVNFETGVVGYTVRFRQLTNSDGTAFVDDDRNPDIWHTYVNGTSQDFQGEPSIPSLTIRNLADGTYDFEVVAHELAIPALISREPDSARHVTLQGGAGNDAINGMRLFRTLQGGLVDDFWTNPLLQNNPNAPLPLGFIFNPAPYDVAVSRPDRFATYLDGGFGDDFLNGDYVYDGLGDDYTFQNVVFKGLNTMLGGQGSDTFVVKNGGNAIGDEFDWVVKYGNETPVVTEAGNVGSSLNGGQHNVVYSLVDYLTLSDTLVHQGKFIDQLIVAYGFGMGNGLENYISGSGTLVGNTGRDSISGVGLLIGGTAYGTDDVGFAVRDFAGFIYGGNGLVESAFRDTDPVPTDPNGPGAADPSQFWVVPGNYGPVFDPNRNQDTLIAGLSSTLDGGAGRDSLVGSGGIGDMFYVSQGEGGLESHNIASQDAVFGNEGNDTVMFTDSDYLWWTGHLQGALLDKNEYSIERSPSDSDISNLILQAGSPSARIAIGNDDSKGNPNEGSNMIVGNEFDNVIDGGGVGGNNKNGEGVDWLVGGSGSDNFVVQGYTSSLTNEWSPAIIDYETGPLAGFSVWFPQRDKSTYTDADYVVIEDFEAGDNLELSASTGSYWIGAAPGNGFALSFNNNVPLLGYLQKPDTTRFGIYTAGVPNLVAIVNLAGGLELDRLSLELAYDPAPSNLVATNSPFRARLGWGTFWKLEGSSFSKYVNQAYTMEDSYASLETLVRSGDDTFTGGVLADNYNGYGANDSLLGGGGNDTLLGESGNDSLFGEAGNDSLLGGKGSDYIDGGFGDDQMIGGTGDDIFVVDALTDAVTEQANEGTDLVIASVSGYALTANANVENLTLAGTAINGSGNALDNRLTGNAENNTLTGLAGNDTLDGGVGTDTLDGGADDDTYIVDTKNDTIEDASGTDTVRASGDFDLSDAKVAGGTGIENLLYTGTTTGVSLVGNINANSITGAAGSDTLDGKDGLNTLVGGSGDDFYVLAVNDDDRIVDTAGTDTALATGTLSLATLSGGSSIENIQLTSGSGTLTGNALSNTIRGFTGADYLVGGTANDSLSGGGGNDTLVGCSSSARGAGEVDTLTGNAGIDIFVLGDSSGVYYDADGEKDYAIITDFGKGTDLLQLNGVAGDYAFGSLTGGYYDLTYTDELIAKVKGSALVTADLPTIANFV